MYTQFLFIFFFSSFMTLAQSLKKKELIGTWKVEDIYELRTDQTFKMGFQDVKTVFKDAIFTFNKDSSCKLRTNKEHINTFFKNLYWYYNKKKSSVKLLKHNNHSSNSGILELSVKRYNELVKFYIDQDVILTVKKQ